MIIGRKRNLLIEKVSSMTNIRSFGIIERNIPFAFTPFQSTDFYYRNRFVVQLEDSSENVLIDYNKISACKITDKLIKIEVILSIDEWVEKFKMVKIAKIELLDATGYPIKSIDYDVMFLDYNLEFDWALESIMKPEFTYQILK